MRTTVVSTATVTLSGAEAETISVWLYQNGAEHAPRPVQELLHNLRQVPADNEEVSAQ